MSNYRFPVHEQPSKGKLYAFGSRLLRALGQMRAITRSFWFPFISTVKSAENIYCALWTAYQNTQEFCSFVPFPMGQKPSKSRANFSSIRRKYSWHTQMPKIPNSNGNRHSSFAGISWPPRSIHFRMWAHRRCHRHRPATELRRPSTRAIAPKHCPYHRR